MITLLLGEFGNVPIRFSPAARRTSGDHMRDVFVGQHLPVDMMLLLFSVKVHKILYVSKTHICFFIYLFL